MSLTKEQRKALPKARLFWIRRFITPRNWYSTRRPFFAKFRNANAMFIWLGQLEIGWRMPWLERPARALHPELFTKESQHG